MLLFALCAYFRRRNDRPTTFCRELFSKDEDTEKYPQGCVCKSHELRVYSANQQYGHADALWSLLSLLEVATSAIIMRGGEGKCFLLRPIAEHPQLYLLIFATNATAG
jgi:hypothetical protein